MESTVNEGPVLVAFRLSEERAAAGYLAARKALVAVAARAVSVRQLVTEQPLRADYRAALRAVESAQVEAQRRTVRAFEAWHRAQLRSDAHWTATTGRAA